MTEDQRIAAIEALEALRQAMIALPSDPHLILRARIEVLERQVAELTAEVRGMSWGRGR